jgi:hypothetical protein
VRRGTIPPYRPPAQTVDTLIRWPESFGTRFLVFVDVEEEFDWSAPLEARHRSVTAMRALPTAHARFADRGVGLVCLVDHPVASDTEAVAILRDVVADSYPGNLPRAAQAAKLDVLTDVLGAAFGAAPIVYRAGRYGIGPDTAELLVERGYRVETSIRARYDYSADGGRDFSRIGSEAYRLGSLIEVPLTSVFIGALRDHGAGLYPVLGRVPHGRGIAARSGLLQRIALTPEDMPIEQALAAVRIAVREEGQRLLTFSFHSPSLEPGHTPYVRDARDLDRFWRWWDRMFAELDALGVKPTTLDTIVAAADGPV